VTGVVESVIRWIRFQQVSELLTEVTSVRVRSYCLHFVMRRFMGLNVSRVIGYGSPWPRWQFCSVTPRVCRSRSKFVVAVGESRDVDRTDVRQWSRLGRGVDGPLKLVTTSGPATWTVLARRWDDVGRCAIGKVVLTASFISPISGYFA
jgi:hypothetical protein